MTIAIPRKQISEIMLFPCTLFKSHGYLIGITKLYIYSADTKIGTKAKKYLTYYLRTQMQRIITKTPTFMIQRMQLHRRLCEVSTYRYVII